MEQASTSIVQKRAARMHQLMHCRQSSHLGPKLGSMMNAFENSFENLLDDDSIFKISTGLMIIFEKSPRK